MGCSSSHEASSYSPKATHQTGKGQQGAQGNGQAHTDLYKLSKATLDKREQALVRAEQLFAQTRGKRFHDNYVSLPSIPSRQLPSLAGTDSKDTEGTVSSH